MYLYIYCSVMGIIIFDKKKMGVLEVSMLCLLMPRLLMSPGYQQPWYWPMSKIYIFWFCSSMNLNFCSSAVYKIPHQNHNNIYVNSLRLRQNGRHFADDIFKWIFLNENVWIPIKISLKFVPHGPINNIPALVQIMAWRRPDDKPLSGPMMVRLPTHICVTRPQWVKWTLSSTHL